MPSAVYVMPHPRGEATIAFSVDNGMADEQTTGPPRPGVVN
jgi:hypothetical protein